MSRQRVLGAVLAWLVVVASVSGLVWVVISRAGDDLVASNDPVRTTGTPSAPERPRQSRKPSRSSSPDASATPSDSTASTVPASPSTTAAPTAPTTPTGQPSPTPTVQRRTWQGQAGSVVAACSATGIRLVSAQPSNGFRADVHAENELLDVEFEGREDRSGTHVSVLARCEGGVPSFSVQSEED